MSTVSIYSIIVRFRCQNMHSYTDGAQLNNATSNKPQQEDVKAKPGYKVML